MDPSHRGGRCVPVVADSVRRSRSPRKGLIVSFDIAREGDPTPSLAVGSLLAYARTRPGWGKDFELGHASVLVDGVTRAVPSDIGRRLAEAHDLGGLDVIAVAAYAWSESIVDPVMA